MKLGNRVYLTFHCIPAHIQTKPISSNILYHHFYSSLSLSHISFNGIGFQLERERQWVSLKWELQWLWRENWNKNQKCILEVNIFGPIRIDCTREGESMEMEIVPEGEWERRVRVKEKSQFYDIELLIGGLCGVVKLLKFTLCTFIHV